MTQHLFCCSAGLLLASMLASSCGNPAEESERDARDGLRQEAAEIKRLSAELMRQGSDVRTVSAALTEANAAIYRASTGEATLEWDAVLTSVGDGSSAIAPNSVALRACVRFTGRLGSGSVSVADIPCPAELERDNRFGSYDRTVRLFDGGG